MIFKGRNPWGKSTRNDPYISAPANLLGLFQFLCLTYMTTHVQEAMVQKSRLMRAVTSGGSTGGSLALAFKLLNWAERAEFLAPLAPFSHWTFDCPSFVLGLVCGLFIFFCIEAWVTLRWALLCWLDRRPDHLLAAPRVGRKPLYKLC